MEIMLDLETMGNGSSAAIIAIGAVAFNEVGVISKFYEQINLESSVMAGGEIDASTVIWWMQQSDKARAFFKENKNATDFYTVLSRFRHWFSNVEGAEVWGNGASFDNSILTNAYKMAKEETPWKFWNDRCYRTVKNMHPEVKLKRVGTYHKAVDDAESQALHLLEIRKHC